MTQHVGFALLSTDPRIPYDLGFADSACRHPTPLHDYGFALKFVGRGTFFHCGLDNDRTAPNHSVRAEDYISQHKFPAVLQFEDTVPTHVPPELRRRVDG